jgi:hypothetical protein
MLGCEKKREGLLYYRCGNVTSGPPLQRRCSAPSIRLERIEEAVWDGIWGLLLDPARLHAEAERFVRSQRGPEQEAGRRREMDRAKLRAREERLLRMIKDGLCDYDDGAREVREIRARPGPARGGDPGHGGDLGPAGSRRHRGRLP